MSHSLRAVEAMRGFAEEQAAVLSEVAVACAGECALFLRRWHEGGGAGWLDRAVRARDDAELAVVQLGLVALAHPDDDRYAAHERHALDAIAGADVAAEFCGAGDMRASAPIEDIAQRGATSGPPMAWWYRVAGGKEHERELDRWAQGGER